MDKTQNPQNECKDQMRELFGNTIYVYSRQQAIEDGVLVDVSETAREASFKYPFAMTAEVWSLIEHIPPKFSHEDVKGRLWDVLIMAYYAIKKTRVGKDEIFYEVILHQHHDNRLKLKLLVGPGDDSSPVLTLMLPHQD